MNKLKNNPEFCEYEGCRFWVKKSKTYCDLHFKKLIKKSSLAACFKQYLGKSIKDQLKGKTVLDKVNMLEESNNKFNSKKDSCF